MEIGQAALGANTAVRTQEVPRPSSMGPSFVSELQREAAALGKMEAFLQPLESTPGLPGITQVPPVSALSFGSALAAYKAQETQVGQTKMSDWEKYKEDQLLNSPGGDHYDLEHGRITDGKEQHGFWARIGKDISDAAANVKNFLSDLVFGAQFLYRDEKGEIKEGQRRGLLGSVVDFFTDLGSALSFGAWRPDGENEPRGFLGRAGFFFSKVKEAVFGDLIQGVSGSIVNIGKDLLLAGWNALEVIPDATIGNTEKGREITTAVFDNGQVVLDYLTDILPAGEASIRVHSMDFEEIAPPVGANLNMPEHSTEDTRWRFVRNTPLRKTIETVGSILMDIFSLLTLGKMGFLGNERHHRNY